MKGIRAAGLHSSWIIILAGVAAAMHVGKLPPALPQLQAALGMTLVQAGFFLSVVQVAGMLTGLAVGLMSESLGLKRSMVVGLVLLGLASLAGSLVDTLSALLALRALEGLAFLMVVMPAPSLLRITVSPDRLAGRIGWWGTYMPMGTALALFLGTVLLSVLSWRQWWQLVGMWTLFASVAVATLVRPAASGLPIARGSVLGGWGSRLLGTLRHAGPWLVSLVFCVYSAQWLAVVGFLPSMYSQAGLSPAVNGLLTACVALVNVIGNVMSGRLLQRGWAAHRLLQFGFVAMALGAFGAFAPFFDAGFAARFAALLLLSAVGGLIPGTLFSLALRLTPPTGAVPATVGFMQQWSAAGQFAGPPVVAAVASMAGGWQWTWAVTGSLCLCGITLAELVNRLLRRQVTAD